ncbi:T9SS type A sorting domain-containing protein [candidate division KSB1 bacterium]|nr:T9SS type A sorting domain-containing protein [candidate division KSB1 bacterium]
MKKFVLFTLFLFLFVITSTPFAATTYYVSELFGDDSNDGQSDATPFATIQKAADVMQAGDEVIVDFGEYHETVVPKNNGTDENPIVFKAKDAGEAEISTGDEVAFPTFTNHSGSIYVAENVFRTVNKVSEDGNPLIGKDHPDSLVAASWYQDRMANKLYVWSSDDADPSAHQDSVFFDALSFDIVEGSNITIDGFKITKGIRAIVVTNLEPLPGLVIQNNVFQGNELDNYLLEDDPGIVNDRAIDIDGGAADSVNTYENFVIKNNVFSDYASGIRIRNAGRNSTVSDNTFDAIGLFDENNETIRLEGSTDFGGIQCDGIVFERNWFEVFGRAFYIRYGGIKDITIQNNIAYRCGSIFAILYEGTNINLINNTIVFCASEFAVRYYPECAGSLYNNIFIANYLKPRSLYIEDVTLPHPTIWDYNYWVNVDSAGNGYADNELVRWKDPATGASISKTRGGPHAVYGHPMIAQPDTVDNPAGGYLYYDTIPDMGQPMLAVVTDTTTGDMKLVEGALAIDAGFADVAPVDDFFGLTRDAKPDMGAIEFGTVSNVDYNNIFPTDYTLAQNYPNPFNPTTTIEYKLPESGKIKLTVYNVMGQKVATLHNGFQRTGTHQVIWNGTDDLGKAVTSGVYFYRLEAGSFVKSVKMILMK